MKRNLLSLAVATALAATAGSALALDRATTAGIAGPQQIRMSGATAQDSGIIAFMRRACQAGTLDSYSNSGVNAFSCFFTALGKNVVVQKESNAGSQNGINPVRDNTTLTFLNVATIDTTNCTTSAVQASVAPIAPDTLGLPAYTKWTCAGAGMTTSAVPDIGFSDVDPAVFGESSTGLTVASPNQLLFGVPVTVTLRNALQTAQGLTSGSETAANVPSLTNEQVAGIYSQWIVTGDQLGVAANDIFVARRGDTSGTQKAAELFFLNQGVNLANSPMAFPAPAFGKGPKAFATGDCNTLGAGDIFAGNGTGDVRSCLNELNTNTKFGVGLISMESVQHASGTTSAPGWRYIKLNNVMPTVANAIKGLYPYWTEQALIKRTALAGDASSVYTQFASNLGSSGIMAILNKSFSVFSDANMGGSGEPAGKQQTGLMGPPTIDGTTTCPGTFAANGTTADSQPLNIASKAVNGAVDNRIKPAIVQCAPRG
ncbi:MAG: hypothetical protein WCO67_02435 [Betaproteobacteria bacterium]